MPHYKGASCWDNSCFLLAELLDSSAEDERFSIQIADLELNLRNLVEASNRMIVEKFSTVPLSVQVPIPTNKVKVAKVLTHKER